jgi:DNA helicase-2/ATP-dependent DNA helicase PcrA
MQYGSDGIRFSTIHSLCYSVLARAYNLKAEDILSEAGRLKFFTEFHRQLLYKRVSGVPDDFDEYYRKCNEYINSMAVGTADIQDSKSILRHILR